MKHFLEISQLTPEHIEKLLSQAFTYKRQQLYPNFAKLRMANLFYEHSTRTRTSFELAAYNLNMSVVNLDLANSSESKGETIQDTMANLAAMGINLFVIRHKQEGLPQQLAENLDESIHIINAGDGTHAHPSQAMLDLMTILEHKPNLAKLKIAMIGNIAHSRVANSLQWVFKRMGVGELVLVAPTLWQPQMVHFGRITTSLRDGLENADVVICLRVQKERLLAHEALDLTHYRNDFAITKAVLKTAKPDVIVMHPGPINRGIEMDSDVADGEHSVILNQVQNGVFMRSAIIESLLGD